MIVVEATGAASDGSVTANDLFRIRKHLLQFEEFTEPYQLLAADVNSDDRITASDLLRLWKVLLELEDDFPNDTPSWKSIPAQIELSQDPGQTIDLDFELVKIGNVNG